MHSLPQTDINSKDTIIDKSRKAVPEQSEGFTLIELLVVVAIIGILTSIAVTSFNSFSRNQTVKIAAADLKSQVRLSKTNSSSGKKAEACRVDNLKSDGSASSDLKDDYTLIGHFLTFTVADGTYTGGQRCAASSAVPAFIAALGTTPPILADSFTKKLSQATLVQEIRLYDDSGPACATLGGGTVATVEFLTVNEGADPSKPGAARAGFYTGSLIDGLAPPPALTSALCGTINKIGLVLSSSTTPNQFEVLIEGTGNVYEKKV